MRLLPPSFLSSTGFSGSLAPQVLWHFLQPSPGPEHIIHAGEEKVAQCLSNASLRRMEKGMASRLLEAARNTVGVLQKEPALGIKISILGERLLNLQVAIDKVEKEMVVLFGRLLYKPEDFPLGRIPSLATIVSEIGDTHRFPTLKQFLSHFGWCPPTFQTGNHWLEHPKMSQYATLRSIAFICL